MTNIRSLKTCRTYGATPHNPGREVTAYRVAGQPVTAGDPCTVTTTDGYVIPGRIVAAEEIGQHVVVVVR